MKKDKSAGRLPSNTATEFFAGEGEEEGYGDEF